MKFGMNYAPDAGSLAQLIDLQSSELPLCQDTFQDASTSSLVTFPTSFYAQRDGIFLRACVLFNYVFQELARGEATQAFSWISQ